MKEDIVFEVSLVITALGYELIGINEVRFEGVEIDETILTFRFSAFQPFQLISMECYSFFKASNAASSVS